MKYRVWIAYDFDTIEEATACQDQHLEDGNATKLEQIQEEDQ